MNNKLCIGLGASIAILSAAAGATVAACSSSIGDPNLVVDLAICFGGTAVISLAATIYCLCGSSEDQGNANAVADQVELAPVEAPEPTVPIAIVVNGPSEPDPERNSSNELPPQPGPFTPNELLYAPSPRLIKAERPR